MRTSVITPVLAVALVVGTACKGPDSLDDTNLDHFAYVARGANVIPTAADTAARTTGAVLGNAGASLTFTFHAVKLPTGATQIDSIFLYTIGASAANYSVGNTGATTYVAPSARLCGSTIGVPATGVAAATPSACTDGATITGQPTTVTATNGTVTTNTAATLTSSMRGYGQQMVFFTSGQFYKRGTIRGTPYVAP